MLRDPRQYPDPFVFNPERFLTREGTINKSVRHPATIVFGFGRRICPGRYMAMNSLWITIASVLTCFVIEPDGPLVRLPNDPDGYTSGIIRYVSIVGFVVCSSRGLK
jgi:cytochrome P450